MPDKPLNDDMNAPALPAPLSAQPPHSRLGLAALGLMALVWAVALWFAYGPALGVPLPQHTEPWLDYLWAAMGLALIFALVGLMLRGCRKKFATLALAAAVLTPIAFVWLGFITLGAAALD